MWQRLRHQYPLIARILLGILAVALLVYLEPREGRFQYEFEAGKPWLHEDLIAPFDFALQKTEAQLDQERAQVRSFARPVFREDSITAQRSVRNALDALAYTPELREEQRPVATRLARSVLGHLYRQGVVEMAEVILDQPQDEPIILYSDHFEKEVELREVYSLNEATDYLEAKTNGWLPSDSTWFTNLLLEHLAPNFRYDPELTQQRLENELDRITTSYGKVSQDELIVNRGQLVEDDIYRKLVSLRDTYEGARDRSQHRFWIWAGQAALAAAAMFVLFLYLYLFRIEITLEANKFTFILVLFTAFAALGLLPQYQTEVPLELLPFCILPLLIRNFFDTRIASFVFIITILFIGYFAPNAYEFVFIQSLAGLVGVFSMSGLRRRSQFLLTALSIFATYATLHLAFFLTKQGSWEALDRTSFAYYGLSALLTLLSYPLIFALEKTFGLISEVTLLELSDTNRPLLRKLAQQAPGTFQHSLQVANLAEEAATEIGANALLVRTGALYHDIGKMKHPAFFIENQAQGINPHDEIPPERSASIIIDHVIEGIEMARKARLPEAIIDFIRTHHGTTEVRFFLHKAKEADPDADPAKFRYPGPVPYSKETALLMMADSVEAASRSLPEYSDKAIEGLVASILDYQLREGQFDQAPITLSEIHRVKRLFQKRLKSMYHVRVAYPKSA